MSEKPNVTAVSNGIRISATDDDLRREIEKRVANAREAIRAMQLPDAEKAQLLAELDAIVSGWSVSASLGSILDRIQNVQARANTEVGTTTVNQQVKLAYAIDIADLGEAAKKRINDTYRLLTKVGELTREERVELIISITPGEPVDQKTAAIVEGLPGTQETIAALQKDADAAIQVTIQLEREMVEQKRIMDDPSTSPAEKEDARVNYYTRGVGERRLGKAKEYFEAIYQKMDPTMQRLMDSMAFGDDRELDARMAIKRAMDVYRDPERLSRAQEALNNPDGKYPEDVMKDAAALQFTTVLAARVALDVARERAQEIAQAPTHEAKTAIIMAGMREKDPRLGNVLDDDLKVLVEEVAKKDAASITDSNIWAMAQQTAGAAMLNFEGAASSAMDVMHEMGIRGFLKRFNKEADPELRAAIDTDGDGTMDYEEVKAALLKHGISYKQMAGMDGDGNHRAISYNEFRASMALIKEQENISAQFAGATDRQGNKIFDRNGDGELTINEIRNTLQRAGVDLDDFKDIKDESEMLEAAMQTAVRIQAERGQGR